MKPLSTEARLAGAFVIVLGATLLITFVVLHTLLGADASRELDLELKSQAARVEKELSHERMADAAAVQDLVALRTAQEAAGEPPVTSVRDARGSIVASSLAVDGMELLPESLLNSVLAGNDGYHTVAASGGQHLRVYTRPVRDADGNVYAVVQTAGQLDPLLNSTTRVEMILGLVGVAALALGATIAVALTRTTMAPLRRLIRFLEKERGPLSTERPEPGGSSDMQLLARTLDALFDRFHDDIQRRQRFVNTISHDLRTPLTSLQGTLDVLLLEPDLERDVARRLRVMRDECGRLLRLSQNLLLLGRAEIGLSFERSEMELSELLYGVVEQAPWDAPKRSVRLDVRSRTRMAVDGDRLRQAVLNLMDNAVRHGSGAVTVRLRRHGGDALIEVCDEGPGLPPAARERLHSHRLPWEEQPIAGGLGLAVARWVAEAHGGSIEAETRPGESVVRLRLPAGPPEPAAARSAARDANVMATQPSSSET